MNNEGAYAEEAQAIIVCLVVRNKELTHEEWI